MNAPWLVQLHPLRRWLARFYLRWRFRLFQRHRHERVVLERVGNKSLVVLPGVMNPALFRTGAFLVQTLDSTWIPTGSLVLDMGTGCGIGAVSAAQWTAHVVAVDINPEAVRCARINALLNRVEERIEVRHGDLFVPVEESERFDVVLFNPPFFRGTPTEGFEHAWRADDVVERFARDLEEHLTPTGYALVVLSTDGDTPAFLQAFRTAGLSVELVRERDLWNETLSIYRLRAGWNRHESNPL